MGNILKDKKFEKNKNSNLVETLIVKIDWLTPNGDGTYKNEIVLSPTKFENAKTLAAESELHRILFHLAGGEPDVNSAGYRIVPACITLDIGKNKTRYDTLINSSGELTLIVEEYVLDENDKKILGEDDHYLKKKRDPETYLSTFCGAGHSRNQKSIFIRSDMVDKLDEILRCGIPANIIYDKPSKWNAYYALVCTDSKPVSYTPNVVVVKDYKKMVEDTVDLISVTGTGDNKKYDTSKKKVKRDVEIIPFDGAGLVTPQCALKWVHELNCKSSKGETYIPSCFQFRALPGIKGELMVFDLQEFAHVRGVSKIVDLGGRTWDLFEDNIDVILTESQFKFWKLYTDESECFDCRRWRDEFDKACHGYKRTFNIVSYASHQDDLRNKTKLSYQPLQTINFTDKEVKAISSMGLNIYKNVSSNVKAFLKYRGLMDEVESEDEEPHKAEVPPYYLALQRNEELFYDPYIREKIKEDLDKLKNNLLSGKVFVHGNYQVLMPDIYGLAEWAFHDELGREPKGLLTGPFDVYSDWWNERKATEVDIIRNPHVGMEHRIGKLKNSAELQRWYKYQQTGIVTGMYDTLALALGGADFDGDSVVTSNCQELIDAARRELDAGNGRLLLKDDSRVEKKSVAGVCISDRAALMKVNQMSFSNSIGDVINQVTDLWSVIHTDNIHPVCDYIRIGVIVGGETIDFAKTGEKACFPKEVKAYLKKCKHGHWMRYLPQFQENGKKEERALTDKAIKGNTEVTEKLRKFFDYDCNMNRLSHYAYKCIQEIDCDNAAKEVECRELESALLLLEEDTQMNRNLYKRVKELHKEYQELCKEYRKEANKSKSRKMVAANKFRLFYARCRVELLMKEPDINRLLDMLIMLFYGLHKCNLHGCQPDILWNAFENEMITRSTEKKRSNSIDVKKIKKRYDKIIAYERNTKTERQKRKRVHIKTIDKSSEHSECCVTITKEERRQINKMIDAVRKNKKITRTENAIKIKRILTILIYLSRKIQSKTGEMPWLIMLYNAPDEITRETISDLAGVSGDLVDTTISLLADLGIIERKVLIGKVKIRVNFAEIAGEKWIEEDDYNKAATSIRDYFRLPSEKKT